MQSLQIIAYGNSEAKLSLLALRAVYDPWGDSHAGRVSSLISPLKDIAFNKTNSFFLIIYPNVTLKDCLDGKNSDVSF